MDHCFCSNYYFFKYIFKFLTIPGFRFLFCVRKLIIKNWSSSFNFTLKIKKRKHYFWWQGEIDTTENRHFWHAWKLVWSNTGYQKLCLINSLFPMVSPKSIYPTFPPPNWNLHLSLSSMAAPISAYSRFCICKLISIFFPKLTTLLHYLWSPSSQKASFK